MMNIDTIANGIVIDHIKAGYGIRIFDYLGLDKVDYSVALIMNVSSKKQGKKDIIKIENEISFDVSELGLIDPEATVNIIQNHKITEKKKLSLPEEVEDVIKCKNPRCITSIEKNIKHVFRLVDTEKGVYRCKYCDEKYSIGK
ncbi:MAG TPA: aspartate carbamoyltransferase regulatory subunit [Thermotogota bacterium]|nr:aspartate carbamoyltransferase regulatory subunit [Thermotogota bacterium]HPJ89000.1 aspartate carbamoyltransferase regulatory subunit [Thermotogota bacterium]HPR95511.1 aspartate carbamoyltransferase regulatory subunit [Thermotogota bacterium]